MENIRNHKDMKLVTYLKYVMKPNLRMISIFQTFIHRRDVKKRDYHEQASILWTGNIRPK